MHQTKSALDRIKTHCKAILWAQTLNLPRPLRFPGFKALPHALSGVVGGDICSIFSINPAAMKLKEDYSLKKKVITNLDSILKSRDITLPTKVHLVRTMVFPVVMYGCES